MFGLDQDPWDDYSAPIRKPEYLKDNRFEYESSKALNFINQMNEDAKQFNL